VEVSIVMPAYNEEANIEDTVRRCLATLDRMGLEGEVVVTDDGSKDRTGEILARLREEDPRLVVETNRPNQGYGNALRRAIRAARGRKIATIDSDGQFAIEELPLLWELGQRARVVTGFRKKKQDSAFRVFADRGLNLLIRLLFRVRLRDTNCAFKLIDAEALESFEIETNGYQTPTEIVLKLSTLGEQILEVGITHTAREGGVSALRPWRTMVDMFAFLIYMKLKQILFRRRVIARL